MRAGGVILELFCNLVVRHGSWGGHFRAFFVALCVMRAGGVILELFCNLLVRHGSWGGHFRAFL